jgi:tetratricopeptide (TPR) repeat protein
LKSLYGKGETIKGKREERYLVRRCVVTPRGKDAGKFLRPLMTRRALIGSGAAALSGAALTAWLGRSAIERWMHPLPAKRFVALMAWPAATPEDAPLIAGVLNTIYRRLSRAEASVRDLLVVSPEDRSDQEATGAQRSASDRSPREVADTWGANLVFAVRVVQAASRPVLELQVLDSTATKQLRKDRLLIDASTGGDLGDKASAAAARLLDLPVDQMQLSDDAELAGVSQADRALFDKAKLLRNDPNGLKNSEAIAAFQQLVSVSPRFALAYAELGSLYLQQFFRSHDVAALVLSGKNFGVALSLNPDSESAQLGQAEFQLASGQPDVALAGLTRILRSDPDSSDALLLKAKAYKQLNRPEQQEQIYRELTRVRPNYWPAYNDLGEFLHGEAKNAEAAQCFQTASLLAPKATVPLINLGTVLYEQGRSAEAKAALQRSIAIAPNETALTLLGDISFGEKDYRSALSYYLRAQRLAPKDDFVLTDLGDCYEMLGSHTEMLAAYTQAAGILSSDLAINPNNGQAWMTLAFYHAKIGDKAAAESDIANAERHGAKDVQALFTKARAEALLGRTEEAKALVLRCLDQGWSPANVDLATELSAVRATPEYKERIEKLNAKAS